MSDVEQLAILTHAVEKLTGEVSALKSLVAGGGGAVATRRRGLTIKGVIEETGLRSETAARRWLKQNRVRPYAPGKWYYDAVQSAMARRSFAEARGNAKAGGGS
jgi:hypothetical protein